MKKQYSTKIERLLISVLSAVLFFALTAFFLVGCVTNKDNLYVIQQPQLSDEDQLALSTYHYQDLGDTQITMRADTMYVTQRNLTRPTPQMLADSYTLTTEYGSRTVNFTNYPSPSAALSADMFTSQAEEMGVTTDVYLLYYKYMLLSQGYHLVQDAHTRSANGTLSQDVLFKHPAADSQYGQVAEGNNAVQKVIVLDSAYRSMHATGLYLPAGEAVTVKVEGLSNGEVFSLNVNLHNSLAYNATVNQEAVTAPGATVSNNFFIDTDVIASAGDISAINCHNQLKRQNSRLPYLGGDFQFNANGEYTIGTPFGGILSINPRTCYSAVKITITGAVETPHYILGVTTPQYFETYLKDAPGVYSVLDTENGQLVGPASAMRKVDGDQIDQLAMLWHSFFAVNETFTGGTHDRKNLVKFDIHVPAGAAVALGGYVYACPSSWYNSAMDYEGLLKRGNWGILHEIGHNHGSAFGSVWGFAGTQEGEVRNNALTCLAYLKLLDIGTYRDENGNVAAEHGFVAHPYSNLRHSLNIADKADFNNYGYFEALSMYVNIMHSFGTDKFYELLHTYSDVPSYVEEGTTGNKRSDFAYRCAEVYGLDFRQYFNQMYKAGIVDEMYTDAQLQKLNSLTSYQPVANLYAGGIDGVHTGGDLRVDYAKEVIFDLAGKTLSSGGFEIQQVNQPDNGTLTQNDDGTWQYSFGTGSYTFDQFTFTVLLENGQLHQFLVTMRISLHTSQITHYTGITSRTLEGAMQEIENLIPTQYSQSGSGVADYSNGDNGYELKVSQFIFKAKQNGKHIFYLNADDLAILQFGQSFESLQEKVRITTYTANFLDSNSFEADLEEGKNYAFCVINLNVGGRGKAAVGYKVGNAQNAAVLPEAQVYYPLYSQDAEEYTFVPQFLTSKKSGLVLGTIASEKSEWQVLNAPQSQGGNTETQPLYDEDGKIIEGGEIVVEKTSYLIDGQKNSFYHTIYSGGTIPPMPHEFVIDTAKIQPFNFFEITTRNNVNSYVHKYQLFLSNDNQQWQEISSGDKLSYSNLTARIEFPQVSGRYWKLVVHSTSGGRFTVIAELDAGVAAATQKVVPITSSKLFVTSGWTDSRLVENLPTGRMTTSAKNEKLVLRFYGERIALFGDKDAGFGQADVYIDGQHYGIIDLNSTELSMRQLVFSYEGLELKEHTVEIITLTDNPFRLAFAGIPYTAALLNAPDIYKEKALTITLIVFAVLFVLTAVFVVLCFCVPSFRKFMFHNKTIETYDKRRADGKKDKKQCDAATVQTTTQPQSTAKTGGSKKVDAVAENGDSRKNEEDNQIEQGSAKRKNTAKSTAVGESSDVKKRPSKKS